VKVVERSTPMILLPIDLCGGARRRKSTPLISTGRAARDAAGYRRAQARTAASADRRETSKRGNNFAAGD